ncbi:MAG TPA: hypothetical protein VHW65_08230 [Gemmatimonadales bacterium]|jgi:hypothetical protein|nr:hypothetical protein [Gemmatimonadales bacterium]
MRRILIGVFAGLAISAAPARAQWQLDGWLGTVLNAHSPVTFSESGYPDITTTGHWSTRSWDPTWYYTVRFSHWNDSTGWAFHYIHHKLYLDNPPPGVLYFRITNGVNFFLGERLWRRNGWQWGIGAGPIFTVPISDIRGRIYNKANGIFGSVYELGGAGLEADIGRRVRLLPFTAGMLTLKVTAADLDVHVTNGNATLYNLALHLDYGLSLQTRKK